MTRLMIALITLLLGGGVSQAGHTAKHTAAVEAELKLTVKLVELMRKKKAADDHLVTMRFLTEARTALMKCGTWPALVAHYNQAKKAGDDLEELNAVMVELYQTGTQQPTETISSPEICRSNAKAEARAYHWAANRRISDNVSVAEALKVFHENWLAAIDGTETSSKESLDNYQRRMVRASAEIGALAERVLVEVPLP